MVERDSLGENIIYEKANKRTYKRVLPGQFVIHLRSFQGGFAYSSIEGITSPAYTVLQLLNRKKDTPYFWQIIFNSNRFIDDLKTVTYGIRDGKSISFNDFKTLKFKTPFLLEQQKISTFLTALNKLITLHQRKLSCYARLQAQYIKLFYNVKGLKTRKLCFTNFSSKITLCKLKDISNYENSNFTSTIPSELIENGSYPIYDANIEIAKINTYAQSTPYISIIKDGAGAGRVDLKPAYTSVIGTMGYILAKPGVDIIYLYYLIKNINFDKYQNGSTIPHVYYKDYKEEQVLLPELPEQIKIGKFLLSLEKNIQYSQKLLEELNTIKSSYLNYMFI